ncbi:hypothetical protein GALMADRAFT_273548 [Galerina marginata CBS 339.88]|uniref:F-box domain-containing protein n=1 Tax=Galerina marginata (strain CBS 339.88) TaxID=685588 RepID=A0A067SI85_GALM3|nr:hypothetical protein GALMADRAFT_273548 [Galerina marginata CBS 339.88]
MPTCLPIMDMVPLEIWFTIIRLAVGEHTGEDKLTTCSGALKFIGGEDSEEIKAFRASLVTSRSLVRVNKAWYQMASPFLYEYVLLGRGRGVIPVLAAMKKSQLMVDENASGHPIGWWTKRLDVKMRDMAHEPIQTLNALAGIMTCLPNLRILIFSVTGHGYDLIPALPPVVLRSLSCPETLRAVHWHTDILHPEADDWTSFLEHHPNIESLRSRISVTTGKDKTVRLHSLRTIEILWSPFWDLTRFDLPALQSAICRDPGEGNRLFPQLGRTLTTVQFNVVNDLEDLPLFKTSCPNLLQINFRLSEWYELDIVDIARQQFPPSVNTLGIQIVRGQLSKMLAKDLWDDILPRIVSPAPTLKVIKFLGKLTVRSLRKFPDVLREGVQRMKTLGTIVLDNENYPMS